MKPWAAEADEALRLTLRADTDGTGQLFGEVRWSGFAGAASAWFNLTQLAGVARDLQSTYPLSSTQPLAVKGGVRDDVELGLNFYAVGNIGQVACQVLLSTQPDHSRPESRCSLIVEIPTTYERLGGFARALAQLAAGTAEEAVLTAERI